MRRTCTPTSTSPRRSWRRCRLGQPPPSGDCGGWSWLLRMSERMFDSCVLGVDPGVARLGLAAVAVDGERPVLVWAQTQVATAADVPEADRLRALADAVPARSRHTCRSVWRWTGRVQPGERAHGRSRHRGRHGGGCGSGLSVEEYSPTEIKNAVTGVGNTNKRQVRDALQRVHGFRDLPRKPDAVDAAAVALTLAGARLGRGRSARRLDDLVPRGGRRREGRDPSGARGRRRGATTCPCRRRS